jgi:hypothetical protein
MAVHLYDHNGSTLHFHPVNQTKTAESLGFRMILMQTSGE